MIDRYEAEAAIQLLADQLPEKDDRMIGAMVDANATAPDAWIAEHSEWRERGGISCFRATIQYSNEGSSRLIGGTASK